MEEWTDRWTDRSLGEQADGWTDKRAGKPIND